MKSLLLVLAGFLVPSFVVVEQAQGHGYPIGSGSVEGKYSSGCCGDSRTTVRGTFRQKYRYDGGYGIDHEHGLDSIQVVQLQLKEDTSPSVSLTKLLNNIPSPFVSTAFASSDCPGLDMAIPLTLGQPEDGPSLLAEQSGDHYHTSSWSDCVGPGEPYYSSSCNTWERRCEWRTDYSVYTTCPTGLSNQTCRDDAYADYRYARHELRGGTYYYYEAIHYEDCDWYLVR